MNLWLQSLQDYYESYGYVTMTFRGIKLIRPIQLDLPGTPLSEVYFDNTLDYATRSAWLAAGYPVYYDHIANKSYIKVDRKLLLNDVVPVDTKCECGAAVVKASKHSTWCGAFQ